MVRKATAADEEAVYQLVRALEGRDLPRQRFAEIYTSQQNDFRYISLVWEKGNCVLGFLNLRLESQLHHGGLVAEILEMVVAPACRGQGIGKALVEEGEKFARERGCALLEVTSSCSREDAHRFYQREGFSPTHLKLTKGMGGMKYARRIL